jgi:hypothetical protein
MKTEESFGDSTCEDEIHAAEQELAAFIEAVKKLFGPRQARLAAEDWLNECNLLDNSLRSTSRDWRAVTVAASARMALRLTVEAHHEMSFAASPVAAVGTDTKLLPIPSSNCFASALLV